VVPDGKKAWLSYTQYRKLKLLTQAAWSDHPAQVGELVAFLIDVAKLPLDEKGPTMTVLNNAHALQRRGYKIEELTRAEYELLKSAYSHATRTNPDDMELHETGAHRTLYDILTKKIGLDVEAGRGPVWRRANQLLNENGPEYEKTKAGTRKIVQWGKNEKWHVGLVMGKYDDPDGIRFLCVQCADSFLKEENFISVPEDSVEPAMLLDLTANIQQTRERINAQLIKFEKWAQFPTP